MLDIKDTRSPTQKQLANFTDRRTRIERQIHRIRALQKIYCPAAIQLLAVQGPNVDTHGVPIPSPEAEHIALIFPSELPISCRDTDLASMESRYRDAQCRVSLDYVRHGLLVKRRLYTYKDIHVRQQKRNMRSRSLLDSQQKKIDLAASTYRRAWNAKVRLVGKDNVGWRKLEAADICMLGDEEEEKKKKRRAMKGKRKDAAKRNEHGGVKGVPGAGESTRMVSWIWMAADGEAGFATDEALYAG